MNAELTAGKRWAVPGVTYPDQRHGTEQMADGRAPGSQEPGARSREWAGLEFRMVQALVKMWQARLRRGDKASGL